MLKVAVDGLIVRAVRPGTPLEPPAPVLPVAPPDPVDAALGAKEHPAAQRSVPTTTVTERRREAAPTHPIVRIFIARCSFATMRVGLQIARSGPSLAVTWTHRNPLTSGCVAARYGRGRESLAALCLDER